MIRDNNNPVVKQGKPNLFTIGKIEICRCDYKDYEKYGFADQHYLKGICYGAACYLVYIQDEVAAFASLLAMPIRGHHNCVMFHRIVVSKKWRSIGLGRLITIFLSGVWKNVGKSVYMKVQSKTMGKWQEHEGHLWEATAMNKRSRRLTKEDTERNKARYRKAAYSHRYIGVCLSEYDELTKPAAELRANGLMYNRMEVDASKILGSMLDMTPYFIKDCYLMGMKDLLSKYQTIFQYFKDSADIHKNDSLAYPSDYLELRLKDVGMMTQSRRKRIAYLNAVIRRLIVNDIGIEHLTYCLIHDNLMYGWGLSIDTLINLCRKASNANLMEYKKTLSPIKAYRVNTLVAKKKGLTNKQASNVIRGEITSQRIAELYDATKTDSENLNSFAEHGLNISLRTLKRWRASNGITKYNRKSAIPNI